MRQVRYEKRFLFSATGLLLAASLFLFIFYPRESFWYDETVSAYLATSPWNVIWRWSTQIDIYPPLYFALLKIWAAFAGDSEFSLRLFSLMAGWLSIGVMIRLGAETARDWRSGLVAGLTLLLSGGFLYAYGEVRAYALLLLLALVSTLLLLRSMASKRRLEAIIYGVLAFAVIYTHYSGALLIAAHGLYVVLRRPRRLWMFGIPAAGAALILLGWYRWGVPEGVAFAGSVPLKSTLETYWEFFVYGQVWVDERGRSLALGLAAVGLTASVQRRSLLPVLIVTVPAAVLALAAYWGEAKLSGRHGWAIWIGIALLVGGQFRFRRGRVLTGLWLAGIICLLAFVRPEFEEQYPGGIGDAFDYVAKHADSSDVLLLRNGMLFTASEYYQIPLNYVGMPEGEITNVNHRLELTEALVLLEKVPLAEAGSVWIISFQGNTMDPQGLAYGLAEFMGHIPEDARYFGDVFVARYRIKRGLDELDDYLNGLQGILTLQPDGPTLLGIDIYNERYGAGCPVIFHAWWQRGGKPFGGARMSYRISALTGVPIVQQDSFLSSDLYDFQEFWPYDEAVLGRAALLLPSDTERVKIEMLLYDAWFPSDPIYIFTEEVELDAEPCSFPVLPHS